MRDEVTCPYSECPSTHRARDEPLTVANVAIVEQRLPRISAASFRLASLQLRNNGCCRLPSRRGTPRTLWDMLVLISAASPAAERLGPIAAVRASDADDDFASCVSLLKVPDGVSRLTQGVALIDDRHDVAGFEQLFHTREIRGAWSRQQVAQLLPPGH